MKTVLTVTLTLLIPAVLQGQGTPPAAQSPPPPRVVVRMTGDLGFVSTGGNSSVQTVNLGHKIVAKSGKTTLTEQFSLVHGRSKGETITSLWQGGLRADYALPSIYSSYLSAQYERNTFSGLSSRVTTTAGLTAHLLRRPNNRLSVEGGITLTAQRFVESKKPDVDALGGRAAAAYSRKVGSAFLAQNLEVLPNFRESEKLRANFETAITAPITRQVGIKLSYKVRYDAAPRPGYHSTDRYFTSGLTLSF